MGKAKRTLSVIMAALMLVFTCMTYVPASAAVADPAVAFVGVDHSPLVVGDTETFSFTTKNADTVQYKAILKDAKGTVIEDVTNGYTAAVAGNLPYEVKAKTVFALGKYTLTVYAKRVSDSVEVSYNAALNCVTKDNANRVYANGDLVIDKTTVKAGEKITVTGIKDIGGIAGPYLYRLHIYNATTGTWTNNVVPYFGDKVEWTPSVPGTYVLDVHATTANSTTWKNYLANPTSDKVYGTYEAWKLKTVTVTDADLKVESVSATNAKTIVVKFNKAVDADTVVSGTDTLLNVTLTSVAGAPAITSAAAAASLSDDGKTLTITPNGTDYVNGSYAVTVNDNVEDLAGNAITPYSSVVSLADAVRPTITGITYPVNGTAKVTFAEPMNITTSAALQALVQFKDYNGNVMATQPAVTLAADKASFTVNMATANAVFVTGKAYTMTLVGVADYAGNLITPNPATATFVSSVVDNVNPEVKSVEALDTNKVRITYSEPLSSLGTVNGVAISTATPGGNATVDTTNTVYTVTTNAAVPTLTGVVLVTVAGYADLSGNAGATYTKVLNFVSDSTAPTYVSHEIKTIGADQYLLVKYNESIAVATTGNALAGNYVDAYSITRAFTTVPVVAQAGPPAVYNASLYDPNATGASDTVAIKVTALPNGTYTATVDGALVDDTHGNSAAAKTITFTLGSFTDPTVPVATVVKSAVPATLDIVNTTEDTVLVNYNVDVTPATALNLANYLVEGQQVFSSAIFQNDARHVVLTLKPDTIGITGYRVMTVNNVATSAGKVMAATSTTVKFVENVKPTVISAAIASNSSFTVTFNKAVTSTLGSTTAFEVYVDGVKIANVANVAVNGTTATVNLTNGTTITDLTKTYTIKFVGTDFHDADGNSAVSGTTVKAN